MVGEAQNHDQIMAEARQSLLDQRMGGRRHQAPIGRGSAQLRQQNLMTRIKLIGGSLLAIVLAAMYMLRLISATLHQDTGPAVKEAGGDVRLGELAVLVPLVVCLIGLSAWPNLVSGRAVDHARLTSALPATGWTEYAP